MQVFLRRKLPVVFCRIADLAAAVHHKPDTLCPGQRGLAQPLRHHPGDTPCVGRRHQHHIPPGLHRGGIPCLDAGVQVVKRHLQPFGNAPRQIPAVAGSRKIKYHGCSFVFCLVFSCLSARQTGSCPYAKFTCQSQNKQSPLPKKWSILYKTRGMLIECYSVN